MTNALGIAMVAAGGFLLWCATVGANPKTELLAAFGGKPLGASRTTKPRPVGVTMAGPAPVGGGTPGGTGSRIPV